MAIPTDMALYQKVKKEADAKFLAPTSAYKSAWIVREYKKRGGLYATAAATVATAAAAAAATQSQKTPITRLTRLTGLTRWFDEKWVDLNRGNKPCGRTVTTTKGVYPLCRPSVRVTAQTPKLASELPPSAIKKANAAKQKVKQTKHVRF